MCKAALLVLAACLVANSAVFQVVKEQMSGSVLQDGYEEETAFVD